MKHAADLPTPERERARVWLLAAFIAAAVAAAYSNALHASFQFDDWHVIVDDPAANSLAGWWASMPAIRPLLKLTYALNASLGSGVAAFHATNIAIHAANSLLAFAILARLALREGVERRRALAVALIGALLFALHPVQTEAVTYISGRSTSLSALFSLASLLAWIEGGSRSRGARLLSVFLFALALMVKETAAVIPLAILLWEDGDRAHEPGSDRSAARGGFPWRIPWGHLSVLAGAGAVAAFSPTYRFLLSASLQARNLGDQIPTQVNAIFYLMGQLLWPGRLNADPALPALTSWSAGLVLKACLLLALLVLGLNSRHRRPFLSFGILWFFLCLAPTNSVLPRLDVANDRQLYLALLGCAWLVAWGAGTLLPARRSVALALAIGLVGCLGIATYGRNRGYSDESAYWQDVTRKSPHNPRAFNNLGYAYALSGRRADAEAAFRRALAMNPSDVRAAVNLRLLLQGGLQARPGLGRSSREEP